MAVGPSWNLDAFDREILRRVVTASHSEAMETSRMREVTPSDLATRLSRMLETSPMMNRHTQAEGWWLVNRLREQYYRAYV